jgi:protein arginine N-methyltransferase 1
MYPIADHGKMIADTVRMEAYSNAIRKVLKPGDVVLDVGTGSGIFALLACRFGAGRVFAIEPGHIIQLARETAKANGFDEKIEFIQKRSQDVSLPDRVDLIVSDLRGVLPLFGRHLATIADARHRFLKKSGCLIPRQDSLWAAIVNAPELYRRHTQPWDENPFGFDMQSGSSYRVHTWSKGRVLPRQLLVEPQSWALLDYTVRVNPNVNGALNWSVKKKDLAHGLLIWFDSVLADGISLSNSPHQPELIYGSAFFPWIKPVRLEPEDTVSVSLNGNLIGDDYLWRWDSRIHHQGHPEQIKESFNQSTFFGTPLSTGKLHKAAIGYVPDIHDDIRIDHYILALIDGRTSLGDIANLVSEKFPVRFSNFQDAVNRVGIVLKKYDDSY